MSMTSEQTHTALLVDDEPDIRELLELTLSRMGVHSHSAANLDEAMGLLRRHQFDLCITDMRLPDGNGIDLVRHMQHNHAGVPVAMITAHGNMESAVEALKAGAFDFVTKPVELRVLRELVHTALRLSPARPKDAAGGLSDRLELLGQSRAIDDIRATIDKLARSQAPVYISGASGTGKELVARLIHARGPRAEHPFVPVNCGAIPAELMESELFGHRKGSFTGATGDKDGLFQAADGGTLFLDEVADLPLLMQVKLLRAIQEKAIRPIGAHKEFHVDVRILSATHKDLSQMVREGAFRDDLYYRLNVIELHVPSLQERREDIPLLARHVLDKLGNELGVAPPQLSDSAMNALGAYPFPGNVRELENILERAVTLCEGSTIEPADLRLPAHEPAHTPEVDPGAGTESSGGLEPMLQDIEKETIQRALEQTRYNKTAAAKLLGISFRALRYRLKKLGMD